MDEACRTVRASFAIRAASESEAGKAHAEAGALSVVPNSDGGRHGPNLAKQAASRHPRVQAALSNGGRATLARVDGRTVPGRRYADLVRRLVAERGGEAAMTVSQLEAVRVFAGLSVQLGLMHSDLAAGKAVDAEAMGQLGDRLDRASRRMGSVKAAPKQTLQSYLASKGATP